MKIYPANQVVEVKNFTRKVIVSFLVMSFAMFVPLSTFAATASTTNNPYINDAAEAQGWNNFFSGRVQWAEAQTGLPSYVLTEAEYAQSEFENEISQQGYTEQQNGEITTQSFGFRYTPGVWLALNTTTP